MRARCPHARLLVAAPALGQTTYTKGRVGTVYTGGPSVARQGIAKTAGTSGTGCAVSDVTGVVGMWDLGSSANTIRGGYLMSSGNYVQRTSSAPTLTYPFWAVGWFRVTSASGTQVVLNIGNNDGSQSHGVYTSGTSVVANTNGNSATAASACASNTWECFVAVFSAANSRAIYTRTNTTGATNTTSATPSSFTRVTLGAWNNGSSPLAGTVGPVFVYSGTGPDSNARTALFNGADWRLVAKANGNTLVCGWGLDNSLTDEAGSYDLSLSGSPTAQSNLIAVRDLSGSGAHVVATTAAPTFSTSIGNGQGGGVFASASSQFLLYNATPPVTAAPFQVYAVAQANNITTGHAVFYMGDKDVDGNHSWNLFFRGDLASDPTRFNAINASTGDADINSYSADTNYLLWGQEVASNNRNHERNGTGTSNDTTSAAPAGVDSLAIGMRRDSAPDLPTDGEIHHVLLLNTSSTAEQARIETFYSTVYNLGFTP